MKTLLENFLLVLLPAVCLLFSPVQAQDELPKSYKPPYFEPPKLVVKFEDDFSRDSRGDYQISGKKGAVNWEKGKLLLGNGATLQRKLDAGSWVEMELDLEFPELTEDGQTSEFKVWLDFEDATDSFVWFRQKREEGKTRSAIFVVDTEGEWSQSIGQTSLVEPLIINGPLPNGTWHINYRQGLWSVNNSKREISLFAHINNSNAIAKAMVFSSKHAKTRINELSTSGSNTVRFSLTDEFAAKLAEATNQNSKSVELYQSGRVADAIPLAAFALNTRQSILGEFHPDACQSLNNLAGFYLANRDYDKALPLCLSAQKKYEIVCGKSHPDYALVLNCLATLYQSKGEPRKAEPLFIQAKEVVRKVRGVKDPDFAEMLDNLARNYIARGLFDKAEPLMQRAKAIRLETYGVDSNDYANSVHFLGMLYQRMGKYKEAESYHREALRIREEVTGRQHPLFAASLQNLATLYHAKGAYRKAEAIFLRAKKNIDDTLGVSHPSYAACLNNLADLYRDMGAYEKAEPLLLDSIAIQEGGLRKSSSLYASSINNLAAIHRATGRYHEAETLYLKAISIREKVNGKKHPLYATSMNNLALLYRKTGEHQKAEALIAEVLQIQEKTIGKNHPLYSRSLSNLAAICKSMGRYQESESLYLLANSVFSEDHPDYSSNLNNLAVVKQSTGEFDKAETLLLKSIELQKRLHGSNHPVIAERHLNLASLYCKTDAYEKAEHHYQTGLAIIRENLERYSAIQSVRQQRKYSASFDKSFSSLISTSLKLQDRGHAIFNTAVDWKGMMLVRRKQNLRLARHDSTKRAYSELRSIKNQLTKLIQISPTTEGWAERRESLIAQEEKLEKHIAGLSLKPGVSLADFHASDIKLPEHSCLLDFRRFTYSEPDQSKPGQFKSAPHYLALILQSDQSVQMLDLGPAEKIEDAISSWRGPIEVANRNRSPIDAVAQQAMDRAGVELRQLLWKPLEKHLDQSELVIVSPDGALGRLPLIALPGKQPGSYLLEEKKIVYLPVPALLPQILAKPASSIDPSSRALLVGDIDYGKEVNNLIEERLAQRNLRILQRLQFSALKNSGAEIEGIEALFDQATKLSNAKATERALAQQLKNHSVLHIATHGFFQSPDRFMKNMPLEDTQSFVMAREQAKVLTENPNLLSGLALANANSAGSKEIDEGDNDGILYSAEIAMLPMEHVELAVLSACETSLGTDDNPGEGLIGIQRAFQVAGAKSTVASYWKVNDKATQMLMNRFYKNLIEYSKRAKANNQDPNSTTVRIDALRDAQLWMLRGLNKDQVAQLTRGPDDKTKVKDIKLKKSADPKSPKAEYISHPRYWAAFVLSGDWR